MSLTLITVINYHQLHLWSSSNATVGCFLKGWSNFSCSTSHEQISLLLFVRNSLAWGTCSTELQLHNLLQYSISSDDSDGSVSGDDSVSSDYSDETAAIVPMHLTPVEKKAVLPAISAFSNQATMIPRVDGISSSQGCSTENSGAKFVIILP